MACFACLVPSKIHIRSDDTAALKKQQIFFAAYCNNIMSVQKEHHDNQRYHVMIFLHGLSFRRHIHESERDDTDEAKHTDFCICGILESNKTPITILTSLLFH